MKLIIDIDEQEYKTILANAKLYKDNGWGSADVWDAILNGIPYEPKGDPISREALKKSTIFTKVNNGAELIDIEVVPLETIDNAPTIPLPDFKEGYKQAIIDGKTNYSRTKEEWIPVSERLPEDFCVVLVYCPQFDNIYRVFRESDAWHQFSTSDVLMQAVTHWRPLPKAPESEAEE